MEWINLKVSTIRQPEYVGSAPIQRATWFNVLAYAIEQENGGRLAGARTWHNRQWQQTCGVLAREVKEAPLLLIIEGDDVLVWNYPSDKEDEVRAKREAGRKGGLRSGATRSKHRRSTASSTPPSTSEAPDQAETNGKEWKGREGNRKEKETHTARAREITRTLPEHLKAEPFLAAWADWVDYLGEKHNGRTIPSQTFDAHLRSCLSSRNEVAAEALRTAIARQLREPAFGIPKISVGGAGREPLEAFNPDQPNAHTGGAQEAV
jgi:hypothetical protein